TKKHIARKTFLHSFIILFQFKMNTINFYGFAERYEISYRRRCIKRFGNFPRQSFLFLLLLQISRSKINTYRYLIIIFPCKTLLNEYPILANPDDQLAFILQIVGKLRIKQRFVRYKQSIFWLKKNHGLRRKVVIQLAGMVGIVSANANYFHCASVFYVFKNQNRL